MTNKLFRKKPGAVDPLDPVSANTWAAAALATLRVADMLADLGDGNPVRVALEKDLATATRLTPCALDVFARTSPRKNWSFEDFQRAVSVAKELRRIVVEGMPEGVTTKRQVAAEAVLKLVEEINKYVVLVRRERAMERISGEESLRRVMR